MPGAINLDKLSNENDAAGTPSTGNNYVGS